MKKQGKDFKDCKPCAHLGEEKMPTEKNRGTTKREVFQKRIVRTREEGGVQTGKATT